MFKQLFLAIIFMVSLSAAKEILMGQNGNNIMTMTYIELSGEEEALRVRYRVQKDNPLTKNRAAAGICCTTKIEYPTTDTTDTTGGSTDTTGGSTDTTGGGRNLIANPESNIGRCWGMAFYCGLDKCNKATELDLVLYESSIVGGKWQAATNDFSDKNVGAVNVGSGTDFTTRYSLTQEEADSSSIPELNTNYTSVVDCYTSYDIARGDVQMNTIIDLTDTTKWAKNENVTIKVASDELSPEEEVSGAFSQVLSLGLVSALVAFFTIL